MFTLIQLNALYNSVYVLTLINVLQVSMLIPAFQTTSDRVLNASIVRMTFFSFNYFDLHAFIDINTSFACIQMSGTRHVPLYRPTTQAHGQRALTSTMQRGFSHSHKEHQ